MLIMQYTGIVKMRIEVTPVGFGLIMTTFLFIFFAYMFDVVTLGMLGGIELVITFKYLLKYKPVIHGGQTTWKLKKE